MNSAQSGKLSLLKAWNHAQDSGLCAIFHLGLKSDDIKQCAQSIVPAQLHHGVRLIVWIMGVAQPNRFHGTKAKGFAATFGHDLNRKAAVKIPSCFTGFKLGFFSVEKRIDKGLILLFVHRAIEIGCALFFCVALIIARLHPGAVHVDAIGIYDRSNCIKKGQGLCAGLGLYCLRQSARS